MAVEKDHWNLNLLDIPVLRSKRPNWKSLFRQPKLLVEVEPEEEEAAAAETEVVEIHMAFICIKRGRQPPKAKAQCLLQQCKLQLCGPGQIIMLKLLRLKKIFYKLIIISYNTYIS